MSGLVKRLTARPVLLFVLAAAAAVLVYLGASAAGGAMGFPLDDAWIHQTYARNLGTRSPGFTCISADTG